MFDANIEIIDGDFFKVKLYTVPRVGETIKLFSYSAQAKGKPAKENYEVIRIQHEISEVYEPIHQSHKGAHSVVVFVRPSGGKISDNSSLAD